MAGMDEPVLVPLGVNVSATTLASKRAPSGSLDRLAHTIQYTPEVLENIRMLCAASFVTDGAGVPIIGVLFGTHEEQEIRVTAWAPAGEMRSHNDAEFALKLQLRMAASRPETAGLECLGWVRTRNHGEPRMGEDDKAVFDRCFPHAWQTTMIVRPSFQKPTKAAFYLRGAGDAIRFDRPAQEFFLYPAHDIALDCVAPAVAPRRESRRPELVSPPGSRAASVSSAASGASTAAGLKRLSELSPERVYERGHHVGHQPVYPAAPAPASASSTAPALDPELLPRGTVRAFSPWIAAMLVLVGLLAGAGMDALRRGKAEAPTVALAANEPLLVVHEQGGWAVRWDKSLSDLVGASGGSLAVTRDGFTKTIVLPLAQLRTGSTHLDWVSDDMELALRVDRPGYPEVEQRVRVIGMSKPGAERKRAPLTNL